MKKQLLFVLISILILFSACTINGGEKKAIGDPTAKFELNATVDDDLIAILYFDITDTAYKEFVYTFEHNNATANTEKVVLNHPVKISSVTGKEVPNDQSFVLLNFGPRSKLPDEGEVKYNFKIIKEKSKPAPGDKSDTLEDFKQTYRYRELKKLNSKIVVQHVFVNYSKDPNYPGNINPPIKPVEQP